MKIFSNKKLLFKLIVALCIFLVLTGCIHPNVVHAGWLFETTKGAAETGGKLLTPIIDLVLALFDAILDILQQAIMGTESAITIDTKLQTFLGVMAAILATAIIIAAAVFIGPALAAIASILATVVIGAIGVVTVAGASLAYTAISGAVLPDITLLPTYSISPEEIFKGEILLFDVNIFNPKELYLKAEKDGSEVEIQAKQWDEVDEEGNYTNSYRNSGYEVKNYYYYKDGNSNNKEDSNVIVTSSNNSAFELRGVISKWYYVIRNIALIGLMIVLAYVGIRMLISTTATEKSKYKQMLGDWVIAMCLIFIMQYIMIFANNFTESITLLFASVSDDEYHMVDIIDADSKLIEAVQEIGLGDTVQGNNIYWQTNLMGKARLMAEEQDGTTGYIGYALCYIVLVIFTVIFTVTYAKRLLYITFFTIIAPLVALTYPIDKINDGKAQAFNIWLKEYIFNLLIQPFHLLLYTVLISTAFELAGTNIIYTLVAIGFMIPAEKFLRKMFGFDKASTPGFLEGATGAALAMSGLHSLQKIAGRGHGRGGQRDNTGENDKIDFMDRGSSSGYKTENLLSNIGGQNPGPQNPGPQNPGPQNPGPQNPGPLNPGPQNPGPQNPGPQNPGPQNPGPQNPGPQNPGPITPRRTMPNTIPDPTIGQYLGAKWRRYTRDVRDAYSPENRKENAKKYLRGSIKTAGKIAGITAGGMIGAASDLASGSFGKNMATGVIAGEAIGTGAANMTNDMIDNVGKDNEETLKEIYGDRYSEYMKQKKDEMFMRDHNMREMYSREFSTELSGLRGNAKKEKLNQIMNDAVEYRRYGVKDNGAIIKAMKMDGGNENNWKDPERIAAARFAQSVKSEKDLDAVIKRYQQTPGITQDQANTMRDRIRRINNDIL